jgi:hypothetical protein
MGFSPDSGMKVRRIWISNSPHLEGGRDDKEEVNETVTHPVSVTSNGGLSTAG